MNYYFTHMPTHTLLKLTKSEGDSLAYELLKLTKSEGGSLAYEFDFGRDSTLIRAQNKVQEAINKLGKDGWAVQFGSDTQAYAINQAVEEQFDIVIEIRR